MCAQYVYAHEITGIEELRQAIVGPLAAVGVHMMEKVDGRALIDKFPQFRYDLIKAMGRKIDQMGK